VYLFTSFLTGLKPFSAATFNATVECILMGRVNIPKHLSHEAQSLLSELLNLDTQERLQSGIIIRSHPFFAGLNWDQLYQKGIKAPWKPLTEEKFARFLPDSEMSDTLVMPNFNANFMGFTYASPSLEHLMKQQ